MGKLKEKEAQVEKAKRAVSMLQQRDKFNQDLRNNWQSQLKQMEQAVLLCSQIHGRDRKKFAAELAEKDEEIKKLRAYVQKMHEMRNKQAKGMNQRIRMPVGRKGKAGKAGAGHKKRRPSRPAKA